MILIIKDKRYVDTELVLEQDSLDEMKLTVIEFSSPASFYLNRETATELCDALNNWLVERQE